MKIHIYYRHYNTKSKQEPYRPIWFYYDKCYRNLLETTDNTCRLNVVYDGNDIKENWIDSYHKDNAYVIEAGSDWVSFFKTLDIIKNDTNVNPEDLIYVLENDYMHQHGWPEKIIELFNTVSNIGYVSLYDHMDKYTHSMYSDLLSYIFVTKTHHWRTTPSTCGSFIMNKHLFDADYDILSTMQGDHNKFLWLNSNRGRTVITPIPGLSTHCMNTLLSPTIDWHTK